MRRRAWGAVCVVPVGLVALVWGVGAVREAAWSRTVPFDAGVWREHTESSAPSPRHGMADAVRVALLRDRPTRDETHDLLGEPDFGNPKGDYWTLGCPPQWFWWDDCGLEVGYDAAGRVSTVDVAHPDH